MDSSSRRTPATAPPDPDATTHVRTAEARVDAILRRTLKTAGGGIWLWDLRTHERSWSDETYRLYKLAGKPEK